MTFAAKRRRVTNLEPALPATGERLLITPSARVTNPESALPATGERLRLTSSPGTVATAGLQGAGCGLGPSARPRRTSPRARRLPRATSASLRRAVYICIYLFVYIYLQVPAADWGLLRDLAGPAPGHCGCQRRPRLHGHDPFGPGCEDHDAHRGVREGPPGHSGDHQHFCCRGECSASRCRPPRTRL
jgi:hypothetical protein